MNIVFFGTPEFAQSFLTALHADSGISISAIITQPDKPVGRKKLLTAPVTKTFGLDQSIPVYQPETKTALASLFSNELKDINADAFVVVAYGKIIPQAVLDIPKLGTVNVHPSKLPQYRGPSPLQAAIVNRDSETAVSIMLIDAEMDHGPVLKQIPITLSKDETMESLQAKAVKLGAPALIESLKGLMNGSIEAQEQDHGVATYCKMLGREDAHVDWNESAVQIEAKLRAYHPWPGLWTNWNDLRVKFSQGRATEGMMDPGTTREVEGELYIGTGAGIFAVQEIQIEGSSKQSIESVLKSHPNLGMTIFR